ncbi:MAG: lysophospholipase [Clostridiales Family XIII bacterium]|jgi:alpha-beta hydrolase superfamily lysophospholipase|nr:lysophospholipase [Clostridiales Family XIII bacterium]
MIQQTEWMRPASSGREDIRSFKWEDAEPKAVVQIAHGMAEYPPRYDGFARFLAGRGYSVYMNEHAGHGPHAETPGYFAEKNGMDYVVSDMRSLTEYAAGEHPGLPVFLIGHSMGSFLARKYITLYGKDLAGCVLSGTAGPNPLLGMGLLLSALQKKIKGPKSDGRLLTAIAFGAYTKNIENPVNSCAWLSTVDDVCIDYANDEYCGFSFTAAGFNDLFSLMGEINKKDWAGKVPNELPLYLFAGGEDPVGDYGKGVETVYRRLAESGQRDITLKLYPGGRHEMLNERNKTEVYEDVAGWMDAR